MVAGYADGAGNVAGGVTVGSADVDEDDIVGLAEVLDVIEVDVDARAAVLLQQRCRNRRDSRKCRHDECAGQRANDCLGRRIECLQFSNSVAPSGNVKCLQFF